LRKVPSLKFNYRNFISNYKHQIGISFVTLALWMTFLIGAPRSFLRPEIYLSFMITIPYLAVLSLPLTLVIVCGEIDLSFPSIMGFCGWLMAFVFVTTKNLALALTISLLMGLFAGAVNGILITRFGIPSLITTIGTMFFWRGLTNVCSGGWGIQLIEAKGQILHQLLVGRVFGVIPAETFWTIGIAIILWLVLNRHKIGGYIYYTGDNEEVAKMMGIDTRRIKILVFSIVGLCSAFSAILINLETLYLYPTLGEGYMLPALAAVFFGGTPPTGGVGTIFGSLVGSIAIGILEAGIVAMGLTGFWTQLVCGLLIVIAIIFHSYIAKGGR